MRRITCSNNVGYSATFGETSFSPFILAHVDGIYAVNNNVTISQNTMIDGGTYQGSVAAVRNIVLTLAYPPQDIYAMDDRSVLYALFPAGTKGTLTYEEDGKKRVIDYYVESITQSAAKKRLFTVSLQCPDPFFYAPNSVTVQMANWIAGFEFPHVFPTAGEEFGYRSPERLQNIVNDNAAGGIGITVKITANGPAQSPTISHVETDTHITVGSTAKPLNMISGDVVMITTETNDKHVYFIREGVRTEINEYLTEDSEFIQLQRGNNNIGYGASSGDANLAIEISYRLKYEGA